MEQWKDIKGYDGVYQVSNYGKVKNLKRELNPYLSQTNYLVVSLSKKNIKKNVKVHRLVAEHFIEKIDGKDFVNHKDGNKLNNNIDNLEWVTKSENTKHAYDIGLKIGMSCEKHPMAKLSNSKIEEIRKIGRSKKLREIASMYGVCITTISYILTNKTWKVGA